MMKLSLFSIMMLCIFSSCNSQSSTKQQAQQVKKAMEDAPRPGTMATQNGGWTMTAKIDGKQFTATSIMPPEAASRIIGYYKDAYIGLPNFENRWRAVGKKIVFSESDATDLSIQDDPNFWGGRKGEMVITKLDDQWLEASFHFTASSQSSGSSKTIEVTDGFLRVVVPKNNFF